VLLPGEDLKITSTSATGATALDNASDYGGAVVASLADGESVHEIAVTAFISRDDDGRTSLRGVSRCRLIALVGDTVPLVRAERMPDPPAAHERAHHIARLLLAHYTRLCRSTGRPFAVPASPDDLTALTWRIAADLALTAEQQQGFLNVPDAVTRGRLLLVAIRDLERRERFLRPWAHLRSGTTWN
jgi:hypothetical protein